MASLAKPVAANYDDLPLTNFPAAEDTFDRMTDISNSLLSAMKQYETYYQAGNLTACADLLNKNPALAQCFFNADKYNQLRDSMLAMERYTLNQVDDIYNTAIKNAVGINDNPTEAQKPVVTYSAEMLDKLLKESFQATIVTLTRGNWYGNTAPYTQTVTVKGTTAQTDYVLLSYLSQSVTTSQAKDYAKQFAKLTSGGRAITSKDKVTFSVLLKPTGDISVALLKLWGEKFTIQDEKVVLVQEGNVDDAD